MSRIASALCAGVITVSAWAAPALSSPPLVAPRPTIPDTLRARERAREDSVSALQPHLSGGRSLAVGFVTTLAPAGIALLTNPPGSDNNIAWEGSLAIGVAIGLFAGPAIGLTVGGRGDLAKRGLLIRGIGYAATLLGLLAFASSFEDSGTGNGGEAAVLVGAVGAGVSVVSGLHDLAITPSAVDRGRGVSVRPVVDEHGRLALRATF